MSIGTTITILVVCVLLASLTPPDLSHAESGRPGRDASPPPGRFIEAYIARLGLDEQTLAAIRTIVETAHLRGAALGSELHQAHAQMRTLLSQEMPDAAAVMQQADTIGALEIAERKQRLQALLQIRALLTPAQRQELNRLQEQTLARRRLDSLPACQTDSANLCPDVTPGRARIQCLHDHSTALSVACRAALQTHPRDGQQP